MTYFYLYCVIFTDIAGLNEKHVKRMKIKLNK